MKLYQVGDLLHTMRDKYGLDGTDLMLLGDFNSLGDGLFQLAY